MHNLPTPIYSSKNPSKSQSELIDSWRKKLEHHTFEDSLRWAIETHGLKCAYATRLSMEDTIVLDMLRQMIPDIPVVDFISQLMVPEIWPPLTPEEMERKTFDGTKARGELLDRFAIEHLCKRYETTIRQYDVWIVGAHRELDSRLDQVAPVDWLDRFGVIRVSPLAHYDRRAVEHAHNALSQGFACPIEWNAPANSCKYEEMPEEELTSYHYFRGPASTRR